MEQLSHQLQQLTSVVLPEIFQLFQPTQLTILGPVLASMEDEM